ncbi:succinoglycan biosynthesis protein ExoI [Sinorhizobium fredii]|uniref:Succinoglycan biosynthesis protein ExoI n=1 Tax=Sinorhizobium fredii (strain USDA 257) TaxID=1185652 RepID=I3X6G6_SINF2|nr:MULTISPECIES: thermonuclease family protein [Sinorhizobium]AFL51472.1 succinoglycan biosynthesis protein ExoI [Sinorhizobium fredii USDA 257]PDT82320.1 nuclease [Sinorhizobium sp. BJ1]
MMLRYFLAAAQISLLAISPALGGAGPIIGRATVIDGDTIEIRGERIRLHGVDAPESWQRCGDGDGGAYRCGKDAAFALNRFLTASRPTRCDVLERDRYGRFVGICFRADGREINHWLVESGNAVDWEAYSKGAYADAQEFARSRGAGIWRGQFQLPCQARAERAKRGPSC